MGARERRKGAVFEREVASLAREHGFVDSARGGHRQVQLADKEASDVVEVGPLWIECKRHETIALNKWMAQALAGALFARKVPIVVSRQTRRPALGGPLGRWCAAPFDWLLELVAALIGLLECHDEALVPLDEIEARVARARRALRGIYG